MRRALSVLIAVLLAVPAGNGAAAAANGTIQGSVHKEGRPLAGVTVAFIELQTGAVVRATSGEDGTFVASAPPGEYAVTTESQAGLTVGQAPVKVAVVAGKVSSAEVELVSVPSAVTPEPAAQGAPPATTTAPPAAPPVAVPVEGQAAAAQPQAPPVTEGQAPGIFAETTGTGAQIRFEPVTCFVAGEFPLLDAEISPVESVARARVYFRSAHGSAFYYVEMTHETGRFFGKLPRPRVEASPITYYLQSTTTEFEESQTREIDAVVVPKKEDCGDRKVAAYGPSGPVTVFSASTGASTAPSGFAAAGAGIAAAAVAIIAAGAAAAGIVGGVVVPPAATPPPITIVPAPIPTPVPLPTPTPITTFR
jgi:hypothetical protein